MLVLRVLVQRLVPLTAVLSSKPIHVGCPCFQFAEFRLTVGVLGSPNPNPHDKGLWNSHMGYGLNLGWGGPIGDCIGFCGGPILGYTTDLGVTRARTCESRSKLVELASRVMPTLSALYYSLFPIYSRPVPTWRSHPSNDRLLQSAYYRFRPGLI